MKNILSALTTSLILCSVGQAAQPAKPNILVILADDLGYGDVQCYNRERGKIPTPNIDRLATQGMLFTDGHSSSSVCSPSRFSLLTGRYHWRTKLQKGIVGVYGPPLIAPDRLTIAGMLKEQGYKTAAIGKWHLGWDWPIPKESRALFFDERKSVLAPTDAQKSVWREVFSKPIGGGPTTRGFDSYFGTDVPNWPPFCFIQNDCTQGIPSEYLPAPYLPSTMAALNGPTLTGWKMEDILPTLVDRASEFIAQSAKQSKPFFLYLPLTSPHTPLAVTTEWNGKSGLNTYADFVMETDAAVGRVLDALEKSGAVANTLVVFTSDNGCSDKSNFKELEAKGHFSSGPLRGHKFEIWEGGHREPFLVRWPNVVKAGTRCSQNVQHADLMATCAEILGVNLPANAAEDSVSFLPLLKGSPQPVREVAVNQSIGGLLALRKGPWKLIFGPGPGSSSGVGEKNSPDDGQPAQLYNLTDDLGETTNLYGQHPELISEMTALMEKIVDDGRSTPGPKQSNDVPVAWKRFLLPQITSSKTEIKSAKAPMLIVTKHVGVVGHDD